MASCVTLFTFSSSSKGQRTGLIKEPAIFPLASVFVFRLCLIDLGSFSFSMIAKVKATLYFCEVSLSLSVRVCV